MALTTPWSIGAAGGQHGKLPGPAHLLVQQGLHHVVGHLGTESQELSWRRAHPSHPSHPYTVLWQRPTDLIQTALVSLPLVLIGLGQRRVLCLQG